MSPRNLIVKDDNRSTVLQAENITKDFHGLRAVDDVCFSLERGDFLSLFGPNGAGKTTLLKILALLLKPSAGKVRILESEPESFNGSAKRELGLVSHYSLLYDDLTVMENMEYYASLYGLSRSDDYVKNLLQKVGMHRFGHRKVKTLSRGMQQRLSISRALINDPSILLLDEPYGGLDPSASRMLTSQLQELRQQGRTIVMVTHDLERGLEVATSAGMLVAGKLVFMQSTNEVTPCEFASRYHELMEAC